MLGDIRHALRLVSRNPGFSLVACLTLALGIGANTVIFSVVDAALFRPLPYKDAERLVDVWVEAQLKSGASTLVRASGRHAERLRAVARVFDGVEVFSDPRPKALSAGSDQSPQMGAVAPRFPGFLGVSPQLGRGFTHDDVLAGDTIVISDGYWQRMFNRDRDVLGKTIAFADRTCVVVGVMPPTFRYFVGAQTDGWLPIAERDGDRLAARIRPGITVEQAQRELNAALALSGGRPSRFEISPAGWDRGVEFGARGLERSTRAMLLSLFGAVGFVLVIACANVANLLVSRTFARQREIAVRGAVGATRFRLARQFLIESLVLAGLGGAAAIGLAWCGIRAIPALVPANLIRTVLGASLPQLDARVLVFGVAAAVLTGLLCGAVPALRGSHPVTAGGLLAGGQSIAGSSRGQRRVRNAFQALQVAMTMVLLAGAGLLLASFLRMLTVPRGFDEANLGYALLEFPPQEYAQSPRLRAFFDELTARMSAFPGVNAVTAGLPPVSGYAGQQLLLEGSGGQPSIAVPLELFPVQPDYFRVARIPLKEGRMFGPEDGPNAPPVAIISENAARRFWPGQSAIGRRFRLFAETPPLTIVGVVPHIRTINLARDGVEAYVPATQHGLPRSLLFRMTRDPAPVIAAIRAEVRAIGVRVTVTRIGMVSTYFAEFDPLGSPRFYAVLLSLFAGVALLTAAVGLYGLLSYSVGQRTREIGVRIALGADLSRMRWLVIGDALAPVAMGVAVGLVASLWLSRFVASQLYQVRPHDPVTFVAIVLLLLAVSAAAAFGPAYRASRVDPVEALRAE